MRLQHDGQQHREGDCHSADVVAVETAAIAAAETNGHIGQKSRPRCVTVLVLMHEQPYRAVPV